MSQKAFSVSLNAHSRLVFRLYHTHFLDNIIYLTRQLKVEHIWIFQYSFLAVDQLLNYVWRLRLIIVKRLSVLLFYQCNADWKLVLMVSLLKWLSFLINEMLR